MMGERRVMQEALFYGFSLEAQGMSPTIICCARSTLVRRLERGSSASGALLQRGRRAALDRSRAPMIRMLIVGYGFGIRLGAAAVRGGPSPIWPIAGSVDCWGSTATSQDHSTFSKNCHGRFRESGSLAQAVLGDRGGALHEGRNRGRRGLRSRLCQHHRSGRASTAQRRQGRRSRSSEFEPRSRRNICRSLMMRPLSGATPVEPKVISCQPISKRPATPLRPTLSPSLCLFRQLPHRSEACSDHGRRGDDDRWSPGGSRRGQDDARPHGRTVRSRSVAPGRRCGLRLGRDDWVAGGRARDRAACETDG